MRVVGMKMLVSASHGRKYSFRKPPRQGRNGRWEACDCVGISFSIADFLILQIQHGVGVLYDLDPCALVSSRASVFLKRSKRDFSLLLATDGIQGANSALETEPSSSSDTLFPPLARSKSILNGLWLR